MEEKWLNIIWWEVQIEQMSELAVPGRRGKLAVSGRMILSDLSAALDRGASVRILTGNQHSKFFE